MSSTAARAVRRRSVRTRSAMSAELFRRSSSCLEKSALTFAMVGGTTSASGTMASRAKARASRVRKRMVRSGRLLREQKGVIEGGQPVTVEREGRHPFARCRAQALCVEGNQSQRGQQGASSLQRRLLARRFVREGANRRQ